MEAALGGTSRAHCNGVGNGFDVVWVVRVCELQSRLNMEPAATGSRLNALNTKAYYLLVALSFIYRMNPTTSLKFAFTLTAVTAVLPVQD